MRTKYSHCDIVRVLTEPQIRDKQIVTPITLINYVKTQKGVVYESDQYSFTNAHLATKNKITLTATRKTDNAEFEITAPKIIQSIEGDTINLTKSRARVTTPTEVRVPTATATPPASSPDKKPVPAQSPAPSPRTVKGPFHDASTNLDTKKIDSKPSPTAPRTHNDATDEAISEPTEQSDDKFLEDLDANEPQSSTGTCMAINDIFRAQTAYLKRKGYKEQLTADQMDTLWIEAFHHDDKKSRDTLISLNLGLAAKTAVKCTKNKDLQVDYAQEGLFIATKNMDKYKLEEKANLQTFLGVIMKNHIKKIINKENHAGITTSEKRMTVSAIVNQSDNDNIDLPMSQQRARARQSLTEYFAEQGRANPEIITDTALEEYDRLSCKSSLNATLPDESGLSNTTYGDTISYQDTVGRWEYLWAQPAETKETTTFQPFGQSPEIVAAEEQIEKLRFENIFQSIYTLEPPEIQALSRKFNLSGASEIEAIQGPQEKTTYRRKTKSALEKLRMLAPDPSLAITPR